MQAFLYFLLTIVATVSGAMTGMGGGVIIKPALDMVGQLDAGTINVLSSITVLSMAAVSVAKHVISKTPIDYKTTIPMAAGAIAGGWMGGELISMLIGDDESTSLVVQNAVLFVMILCIFVYMRKKGSIQGKSVSGIYASAAVGLGLGALSSFLGIGGGPVNVALIIYLFSYGTKQAAVSSVIIILFSQATKVLSILIAGNLKQYDFGMLLPMVIGAVAGGLLGSHLQQKLSEKQVERTFELVQAAVLLICVWNVMRYLL